MLEKIPAPTPREELHVLVIDNQGLVHDVVASALHEIGIKNVSSAFNAFHAKRLCEARQFDFVLLSFNVSHDKDGFHLFEELKHLNHINDTTFQNMDQIICRHPKNKFLIQRLLLD